ncbi:unnamed protein product [Closterium sp. NIES-54]
MHAWHTPPSAVVRRCCLLSATVFFWIAVTSDCHQTISLVLVSLVHLSLRRYCTPLPVAVDTDEPDYQIQRILGHRRRLHRGVSFIDFLVRWCGYDAAGDSWVPSSSLSPDNACLQAYLQSVGAADVASLGGR